MLHLNSFNSFVFTGNGVEALKSVPISIFCFLKALKPIPGINVCCYSCYPHLPFNPL